MSNNRHVAVNRAHWDGIAHEWVAMGERAWTGEPTWGIWQTPETELMLLPENMAGMAAIELGCGTGYFSAWMARRGAQVTGIDISAKQLETARRLADEHAMAIDFIEGNAEDTGLKEASFDFAMSEYGAATWCDPEIWLREAWRLLKPGGRLVFLGNHPLMIVCTPMSGAICDRTLHRPWRGMRSVDWTEVEFDPCGIEFNRSISDWMALFRTIGFDVLGYHELYAREDAEGAEFSVSAEWAKHYPSEHVWDLAKPA